MSASHAARARGLALVARRWLDVADRTTEGLWPRASALLARQALEEAVAGFWETRRQPDMAHASARAQLDCIAPFLGDAELAGSVAYAWSRLSDACHHTGHELGLTAGELSELLQEVNRLTARLEAAGAEARGRARERTGA